MSSERVSNEERLRTHGLRVCRELCAEMGFSAQAFRECVEKCLEEVRRKSLEKCSSAQNLSKLL